MSNKPANQPDREVFTVTQLNRAVRATLEANFPLLWVEGEISNLARPASGHIYFSLKDSNAQVRCAMFRMRKQRINFQPENGMQVLCRANTGLYEARGEYQLIIEHMEEAGDGALRRAFDELKNKLDKQGLFAAEHKQTLPTFPKCVGVVTSATGAAVKDILHVLERRFPALPVIVYPVMVQGDNAANDIANMIRIANERKECGVLIVGRGGGSLEDLWAFNEEPVARAIYNSAIPIVSAVGHEVDFTIADFVADVRAPTPSAAAELISPDRAALWAELTSMKNALARRMQHRLHLYAQHLDSLEKRLQHPGKRLQHINQRLSDLELRLQNGYRLKQQALHQRLMTQHSRLMQLNPAHRIQRYDMQQQTMANRLQQAVNKQLQQRRQQLSSLARTLDTVSPLATLQRGYSIVRDDAGKLVKTAASVNEGDRIDVQLHEGSLSARVEEHNKT
jgi:exodeoxyribonuclease VII large subunit